MSSPYHHSSYQPRHRASTSPFSSSPPPVSPNSSHGYAHYPAGGIKIQSSSPYLHPNSDRLPLAVDEDGVTPAREYVYEKKRYDSGRNSGHWAWERGRETDRVIEAERQRYRERSTESLPSFRSIFGNPREPPTPQTPSSPPHAHRQRDSYSSSMSPPPSAYSAGSYHRYPDDRERYYHGSRTSQSSSSPPYSSVSLEYDFQGRSGRGLGSSLPSSSLPSSEVDEDEFAQRNGDTPNVIDVEPSSHRAYVHALPPSTASEYRLGAASSLPSSSLPSSEVDDDEFATRRRVNHSAIPVAPHFRPAHAYPLPPPPPGRRLVKPADRHPIPSLPEHADETESEVPEERHSVSDLGLLDSSPMRAGTIGRHYSTTYHTSSERGRWEEPLPRKLSPPPFLAAKRLGQRAATSPLRDREQDTDPASVSSFEPLTLDVPVSESRRASAPAIPEGEDWGNRSRYGPLQEADLVQPNLLPTPSPPLSSISALLHSERDVEREEQIQPAPPQTSNSPILEAGTDSCHKDVTMADNEQASCVVQILGRNESELKIEAVEYASSSPNDVSPSACPPPAARSSSLNRQLLPTDAREDLLPKIEDDHPPKVEDDQMQVDFAEPQHDQDGMDDLLNFSDDETPRLKQSRRSPSEPTDELETPYSGHTSVKHRDDSHQPEVRLEPRLLASDRTSADDYDRFYATVLANEAKRKAAKQAREDQMRKERESNPRMDFEMSDPLTEMESAVDEPVEVVKKPHKKAATAPSKPRTSVPTQQKVMKPKAKDVVVPAKPKKKETLPPKPAASHTVAAKSKPAVAAVVPSKPKLPATEALPPKSKQPAAVSSQPKPTKSSLNPTTSSKSASVAVPASSTDKPKPGPPAPVRATEPAKAVPKASKKRKSESDEPSSASTKKRKADSEVPSASTSMHKSRPGPKKKAKVDHSDDDYMDDDVPKLKPKPKSKSSRTSSKPISTFIPAYPMTEEENEAVGLLIECMITSRASSLTVTQLLSTIMETRPALQKKREKEEWRQLFITVLQIGCGDVISKEGFFGKIESSFKDEHDEPLEPKWFYIPERDPDLDRSATILASDLRPGKRRATKGFKQYYYQPLDKISRWDAEDAP